jgi:excisionase family DNA binding protein
MGRRTLRRMTPPHAVDPANIAPITLTAADAARLTGLARTTIYDLAKSGDLEASYLGRKVMIHYGALVSFIDSLPTEAPPTWR